MPVTVYDSTIQIRFAFNKDLLHLVKSIPQRQFKPALPGKPWVVPATPFHAREVLRVLGGSMEISPEVRSLSLRDVSIDRLHSQRSIAVGELVAYPFQVAGVDFLNLVGGRGLICDEVGTGKTIQPILWGREHRVRGVVVIAPASVTFKWEKEFARWWPERHCQVITASKEEIHEGIDTVILSYQMMVRYIQRLMAQEFEMIIFDECFPFNTPVMTDHGPIRIGTLVENQLPYQVLCYNSSSDELVFRPITRWITRERHTDLVRVTHEYGSFVCTANHKIYTDTGYKPASALTGDDYVRVVREGFYDPQSRERLAESAVLRDQLLGKVAHEPTQYSSLAQKRRREYFERQKGQAPASISGTNEAQDAGPGVSSQGGSWAQTMAEGSSYFSGPRWQRATDHTADDPASMSAGIGDGICDFHPSSQRSVPQSTQELQGGCGLPGVQTGSRSGWQQSQDAQMETLGSAQTGDLIRARVVSVEVLESGDPVGLALCCGDDTHVYNIEVEEHHNYFAQGVLVSNCHHLKSYKTQQFRAGQELARGVPYLVGLSGTPLLNKPIEMYNILHMIDPNAWDFWGYMRRFCYDEVAENYQGAYRLDELESRLKMVMIRRFKREVNDQIPAMTRTRVPVDIDMREYRKIFGGDHDTIQKLFPHQNMDTVDQPLVWLNLVRQVLEWEKAKLAVEWIQDFLSGSDERKLLVYCPHLHSMSYLMNELRPLGVTAITGAIEQNKRQPIIDRWQNTLQERIMFVTSAGAEGIDLFGKNGVDCSTILFVGREWGPAPEEQAEGRIDRAGQQYPVEAIYLVARNTIDEDIDDLIQQKRAVIRQAVGVYEHARIESDLLSILRRKGVRFD